jgi:hypothetical protein
LLFVGLGHYLPSSCVCYTQSKKKMLGVVVHACNLSYPEGMGSKNASPYLKNSQSQKGLGCGSPA